MTSMTSKEWLRKLVAFNTVSHNSNLELLEEIKTVLEPLGYGVQYFYNAEKTKANLLATIGPKNKPGVILSGHTDVVPVTNQQWDSDPFQLTESNGKLYGRGTCDMKGFIAVCMAFAPKFAAANLQIPIHFAFSYDEEVGCVGVASLVNHIAALDPKPKYCFVGEPTSMTIVNGHKSKAAYRVVITGHECHSSLIHQGVNAVEYAALIIAELRRMRNDKLANGPFDDRYTPPASSIHCGIIKGGEALNIVPKHCTFEFEWRCLAKDDQCKLLEHVKEFCDKLDKEMKEINSSCGIHIEEIGQGPALDTNVDEDIIKFTVAATGSNVITQVSFLTEASQFQQIGVPTIVIGPGSIEQAHKPNEYVDINQLELCEQFIEKVLNLAETE